MNKEDHEDDAEAKTPSVANAMEALGLDVEDDMSPAWLCGAMAASGFMEVMELPFTDVEVRWGDHHEFARGFTETLGSYSDEPIATWSSILNQLSVAIPAPGDVGAPLELSQAPYYALALAGACCTLLATGPNPTDPGGKAALAQAFFMITNIAQTLSRLGRDDVVSALLKRESGKRKP